ncbi:MAG: hypothetical protein LBK98_02330 [Peptococcaceae bacterium]|jgi:hypothetical protein|nr:hypothetical protein [Peptococcaceae bacterium]
MTGKAVQNDNTGQGGAPARLPGGDGGGAEASDRDGGYGRGMAVLFLLVLFGLSAGQLFWPERVFSARENRYLARRPAVSAGKILSGEYMSQTETYVTDQFPGRDLWVSGKALCQRLWGQKENNGVYFAADGYLIGKPASVDGEIADSNLAAATGLRDSGYEVALLVSPMAAETLREKLPAGAYDPAQGRLLAELRERAPAIFVDAAAALRQGAGAGKQMYYRTDHHWTTLGAYQAYLAYMSWLGEPPAALEEMEDLTVSRDFYGTLWSKTGLPGMEPDEIHRLDGLGEMSYKVVYQGGDDSQPASVYDPAWLREKDQYGYFLGGNPALAVIRRTAGNSPGEGANGGGADEAPVPWRGRRLLLFKDSYAHCFAPFLLAHFEEIHLIDLRYWKQDPIAYLEENGIRQVLFLYNTDNFATDRSVSQVSAYLAAHLPPPPGGEVAG